LPKIPTVAVIVDDESVRRSLERVVTSLGWFQVEHFASAEEFIVSDRIRDAACLILDAHMKGMGGLELQSHLASAGRHIPIIFITASTDERTRAQALRAGALDFLQKPVGEQVFIRELLAALRVGGSETPQ
jgi:FixJ family two-component response regulator